MRVGIVVFLGTNCEVETKRACEFFGWDVEFIWHSQSDLSSFDLIILPGGFSYGDHLSAGRLAKFSPVVESLKTFDGFVLGICNGFQILTEAGLLPGALVRNEDVKFISKTVGLAFEGREFSLPIAHHQGNFYYAGKLPEGIRTIEYKDNPNGSNDNIAGLLDAKNNILGLMPHPERAIFNEQGNVDGRIIFELVKEVMRNANIA